MPEQNPPARPHKPLRVMYFVGYPQRMAGANRSFIALVTSLPPGVEPLVVAPVEGPVVDALRAAGISCTIISPVGAAATLKKEALQVPLFRRLWRLGGLAPFVYGVYRFIRRNRVDLVHANCPISAVLVKPAAVLARRPLVEHVRGELPYSPRLSALAERVGDRMITVSEAVRQSLSPAAREKTRTVYNGIAELPAPRRRIEWLEEKRAQGVCVVCCFASVVPFKGQHHLVEAVAKLNARGWRGDRAVFVCVGDLANQEYAEWVQALAAERGIDNLVFTGWEDDPFAFYAAADVAVLPSVSGERLRLNGREIDVRGNEGFPRTHLEAMRFGLPIVGTRIAGVPEQVEDGVTGLLVEPGDPDGLADALERLIASPELRARMGAAGRQRVERLFSTRAYVRGVLDVYAELLGEARLPPVPRAEAA